MSCSIFLFCFFQPCESYAYHCNIVVIYDDIIYFQQEETELKWLWSKIQYLQTVFLSYKTKTISLYPVLICILLSQWRQSWTRSRTPKKRVRTLTWIFQSCLDSHFFIASWSQATLLYKTLYSTDYEQQNSRINYGNHNTGHSSYVAVKDVVI